MNLQRSLAGKIISSPVIPAAGWCKHMHEVDELCKTEAGAIVVGSATVSLLPGNEGDTYYTSQHFSLNTIGLRNPGKVYYQRHLSEMVAKAHAVGKPLIFSVAGNTPSEFAEMTEVGVEAGVDMVKLNVGCPNKWIRGQQMEIISYNPASVDEVIYFAADVAKARVRIGIKVSPLYPSLLNEVASVIKESGAISAVFCSNTFPNGYYPNLETGKSVISFGKGYGGVAGPALRAIVYGNVMQWAELLPEHIELVAIGGVNSGESALAYLLCSRVTAVGVGTALHDNGPKIFETILQELIELHEFDDIADLGGV